MSAAILQGLANALIWAATALTGPDLTPRQNCLIEIKDGRIASLDSLSGGRISADLTARKDFYCLEGNQVLMPCLIDAHVHLALDGEDFNGAMARWDQEGLLLQRIRQELALYLSHGVGVIRDGGDGRAINLKVARLIQERTIDGPRVIPTGEALRKPGSYGAFLGSGYSAPREVPEIIDRLKSSGIDQLKVIVSGIVSFREYGRVEPTSFAPAELRQLVEAAHEGGLKVMAHASSAEAVDLAVKAGVDSVEHGYFIRIDTLKEMAARNIVWVPTIIPVAVQVREPLVNGRSSKDVELITKTYREHMEKLFLAQELGVPLGLGSDAGAVGVKHGTGIFQEMQLYASAGLSNKSILKSVTSVNARALGLNESLGSIETGKKPYLIGVKGDPLTDLKALERVKWHFLPLRDEEIPGKLNGYDR